MVLTFRPRTPVTYYLGSDPTQGTAEISKYTRALTSTGKRFKMRGINVAQFSPHQFWGYKDPILEDMSGPTPSASTASEPG